MVVAHKETCRLNEENWEPKNTPSQEKSTDFLRSAPGVQSLGKDRLHQTVLGEPRPLAEARNWIPNSARTQKLTQINQRRKS